ncbi:MAG: hypothetical protein ACOYNL_05180 [Rickettsiales bacterium]
MTNPETGRAGPHILGVIFDVDAKGIATDFTAIDFEGKNIRRWARNNYGASVPIYDHLVGANAALFFPIPATSAGLLKEAMDELEKLVKPLTKQQQHEALERGDDPRESTNPFYFRGSNPAVAALERKDCNPVDFTGRTRQVTPSERAEYGRLPSARPRAATNCRSFVQDMLTHIGGVPLDDFAKDGITMPRTSVRDLESFIHYLAGNAEYIDGRYERKLQTHCTPGRLVNCGNGRHAFAFDHGICHGVGSITGALNELKVKDENGKPIRLTTYLLDHSKPFYDPALNDHDLSVVQPAVSHGR